MEFYNYFWFDIDKIGWKFVTRNIILFNLFLYVVSHINNTQLYELQITRINKLYTRTSIAKHFDHNIISYIHDLSFMPLLSKKLIFPFSITGIFHLKIYSYFNQKHGILDSSCIASTMEGQNQKRMRLCNCKCNQVYWNKKKIYHSYILWISKQLYLQFLYIL